MFISTSRSGCLSLLAAAALLIPAAASAQDVSTGMKSNPYTPQVRDMAVELSKTMSEREINALSYVMSNFGVVRAVRLARDQVEDAADQCAAKNPLLSKEMKKRYRAWEKQIDPKLKSNERALNETVESTLFSDPKKVQDYLDMVDKSADYADNTAEKQVVTTTEACRGLLASMDRTEPTLMEFLTGLEWPVPDEPLPGAAAPESAPAPQPQPQPQVEAQQPAPVPAPAEEDETPVVDEKTPDPLHEMGADRDEPEAAPLYNTK